jgi:hypothetical protein
MSFCYVKSGREKTDQARLSRVFDFFSSQAARVSRVAKTRQVSRGQALVEFVVSVLVILLAGFGVADLSRGVSTKLRMTSVGREAGRIFLKNNFDTKNLSQAQLRLQAEVKVYEALKQAMLPDDLATDGKVIITVVRRVINPSETESSDSTDQLKIVHEFPFIGSNAPTESTRVYRNIDAVIAGPPFGEDEGFLPVTMLRLGEELVIVEMFMRFDFYTPVDTLANNLRLDVLYDRSVF